jgi:hypothetical protein
MIIFNIEERGVHRVALFKIFKGNAAKLPSAKTEGYMYITQDRGDIYVDISSTERKQLNANYANKLRDTTDTSKLLDKGDHGQAVYFSGGVPILCREHVDLETNQTIGGVKTFSSPITLGSTGTAGGINLYANGYKVNIVGGTLSANRTLTLPNATGTVALTSHKHTTSASWDNRTLSITAGGSAAVTATIPTTLTGFDTISSTLFKGELEGNADSATKATTVTVTKTNPSSGTTYNLPFVTSTGDVGLLANDGIGYWTREGTTSATGVGELKLGNNIAAGTAGNKQGMIYMYGTSSGYTEIKPSNNTTSNVVINLPSTAGTLALTSSNITGNAATATKLATARTLSISATAGTTGTSFDGSANASLVIPATISGFTKITSAAFAGPLTGNADTATKLKTARTISLTGDVTGSGTFDGSSNLTITATVADNSHSHISLKGNTDNRGVATTPNDYNGEFKVAGLK